MATVYDVFVVSDEPYGLIAASPIETVFSDTGNVTGKFTIPPTRIEMPKLPVTADTKIKICGRRECVDCIDTHKMAMKSPDYTIFERVLALWGGVNGVVIVKSSTVTVGTTYDMLADALSVAETKLGAALDVFFFAKWLDRADQFEDVFVYGGGGKIVRTWNAFGFNALAFTPSGFAKIADMYDPSANPVVCRSFSHVLNAHIQAGALMAATTTPSLLQFDATLTAIRNANTALEAPYSYLKTCETRGAVHAERPRNRRISNELAFFWVVLIVLLVAVTLAVGQRVARLYYDTG